MEYKDYKGRRTEEIKENNICLLGDIVMAEMLKTA